MNASFPYGPSTSGLTAISNYESHIREMIKIVLFTQQGERVNRPTFGAGTAQLVFSLNGDEVASATQFLVQGALQQALGDRINVDAVDVRADDSSLLISVSYTIKGTSTSQTATFERQL